MLQRVMSQFSVEIFCVTVPKSFVGQTFSVSLLSGLEKIYASEGYVMSQFSVDISCLTVPRIFVGEPFCAVF